MIPMGNRALIKFEEHDIGVYLHWNGGRDSVEPFLAYCKLKKYRDDDYGIARLVQVIGNFFGGGLSVGVWNTKGMSDEQLDPGDNGIYYVKDWEIVKRFTRLTQEQNEHDMLAMLTEINSKQPELEQIEEDEIREYVWQQQHKDLAKSLEEFYSGKNDIRTT